MGAAIAACEAVWLKRILKDLGVPITDPIRIFCDNMSSIYLARNPVFHARTKHIEVHYHLSANAFRPRKSIYNTSVRTSKLLTFSRRH